MAQGTITIDAHGGTKAKITATASDIDITDGKTANGEKESDEFTVWKLRYESIFTESNSAVEPVDFDSNTGKVRLFIQQRVRGVVQVYPHDIPDDKVLVRIVQNVTSYRDYVYISPPHGKTKSVRTTNGLHAWDATFDASHPLATRVRDGQTLMISDRDEPAHGWTMDSSDTLYTNL